MSSRWFACRSRPAVVVVVAVEWIGIRTYERPRVATTPTHTAPPTRPHTLPTHRSSRGAGPPRRRPAAWARGGSTGSRGPARTSRGRSGCRRTWDGHGTGRDGGVCVNVECVVSVCLCRHAGTHKTDLDRSERLFMHACKRHALGGLVDLVRLGVPRILLHHAARLGLHAALPLPPVLAEVLAIPA